MNDYWQKQGSEPLFPDLLWSRPENRQHAGKLLIIGGHAHGFAAPAEAFIEAEKAGAGSVQVLLPDHLRSQITKLGGLHLPTEFALSTPSGSFASKSLAELLTTANWADALLLPGDLGRNSETAIVLEKLLQKTQLPITLAKDAVDYFTNNPEPVLKRGNICLVITMAQLQKLASSAKFTTVFTFGMELLQLVEALHEFTKLYDVNIVIKHLDNILVSSGGQVSSTKTSLDIEDNWRVKTAAHACVWWMQTPNKPFESLTSSLHFIV